MRESKYQASLIRKLKDIYPEAIIQKPIWRTQGMPDIIILYKKKWAGLETKRDKDAPFQPNQKYYIDKMNKMSFCRAIYPENEKEVLDDLQQTLKPRRSTRISGGK